MHRPRKKTGIQDNHYNQWVYYTKRNKLNQKMYVQSISQENQSKDNLTFLGYFTNFILEGRSIQT